MTTYTDCAWVFSRIELQKERLSTLPRHVTVLAAERRAVGWAASSGPVFASRLATPGTRGLAVTIFVVTGFHRHVGFVGDYYGDPGGMRPPASSGPFRFWGMDGACWVYLPGRHVEGCPI